MALQGQNNFSQGGINNVGSQDNLLAQITISNIKQLSELSEQNQQQQEQINRQQQQIQEYQKLIQDSNTAVDGLQDRIEVLTSDIKNTRDKTLEPLAVFVGLFTFVSVGFNIFANVKDSSLWISLLLIIAGVVIVFASLVIHAGSLATKENNRRVWTGALIVIGLTIVMSGIAVHIFCDDNDYVEQSSAIETNKQDNADEATE
jgi:uncharacterized membrane protein